MINCQANALNQERKPRTNEREPHVAPRHYGRNLANTYVHSRVCYPPSSDIENVARPEEMRCVGSKRTRELGRDMLLLAASIVESSRAKAHGRNRTVMCCTPTRRQHHSEADIHRQTGRL